jgi:hypothetical protein
LERDPALGARLTSIARESGLLGPQPCAQHNIARTHTTPPARAEAPAGEPPDPFALLRERGEDGLRAVLNELDVAGLRAIVRMHRLDPARISVRWTARDRLVALITEQVRARARHGRAFERI